ncbi:hypothetical protein ACP70R_024042 [Stipagrostis hirtigluma subsp. patula]
MATYVVTCCLPGAASSPAKAASASPSPPCFTTTKSKGSKSKDHARVGRRDFLLRSSELATLAAIFHFGGTKPSYLGVQKNPPSLALCPATNNCVSTSEDISDSNHYAPPYGLRVLKISNVASLRITQELMLVSGKTVLQRNYNPKDGRRGKPISKEEAMKELIEVVTKTKPDNFTPRVVDKTDDYVRVEYESPIFGFVDDVEVWFPPGNKPIVQYRSASRSGFIDFNANKKRIKIGIGKEGLGFRKQLLKDGGGTAASWLIRGAKMNNEE